LIFLDSLHRNQNYYLRLYSAQHRYYIYACLSILLEFFANAGGYNTPVKAIRPQTLFRRRDIAL